MQSGVREEGDIMPHYMCVPEERTNVQNTLRCVLAWVIILLEASAHVFQNDRFCKEHHVSLTYETCASTLRYKITNRDVSALVPAFEHSRKWRP